jgi:hypothetical protein
VERYLGLLFFLLFIQPAGAQQFKKALFFGNSYTYVNDLPGLISQVANSKGDSLWHEQSTPGSYTFQLHCRNPLTPVLIQDTNWDYVILQEQSQLPSWPPDSVQLLVYPYADTLNMWVKQHDSCTSTLFYMTWGRQTGDIENCPWYPQVCTYAGMQARLRQSYLEMGQLFNAEVSPVGVAWQNTRTLYPAIELYAHDGSHPSIYGSYLAACTFYGAIFQKSPAGAYYPPEIPADTAAILQQIAFHTVFDSLDVWYIDTTRVRAGFTSSYLGGGSYQFTNTSVNALAYLWNFGDQSHSAETNPVHVYASAGNYLVRLYANKNCDTSSFAQNINVVSVDPIAHSEERILYPNPARDKVLVNKTWMNTHPSVNYSLSDQAGKIILTGKLEKSIPEITISGLTEGMYIVRLESSSGSTVETLVIRK